MLVKKLRNIADRIEHKHLKLNSMSERKAYRMGYDQAPDGFSKPPKTEFFQNICFNLWNLFQHKLMDISQIVTTDGEELCLMVGEAYSEKGLLQIINSVPEVKNAFTRYEDFVYKGRINGHYLFFKIDDLPEDLADPIVKHL